jgi:hypothetical protein
MGSNLYAVTSSGAALWIAALVVGGGVAGPSIGGDGTIYATGRSLYAVDPTGKVKWSFNLSLDSHSTPAIDNEGTIYFGCNTTRTAADSINFIALNSDGSVKFKLCLRSPDGSVPDIDSHPSISSDGSIYVGSDYPHGFQVFKIR